MYYNLGLYSPEMEQVMLHQMYLYNPDFFHEQGLVLNESHFHQNYTTGGSDGS